MSIRPADRMQMPAAEIIETRNTPSVPHEHAAPPSVPRIETNINEERFGNVNARFQVPWEFLQDNNARSWKEAPLLSFDFLEESLKIH